MSYEAISDAIMVKLAALTGIAATYDYEPPQVESLPMIYSLIDDATFSTAGQVTSRRYITMHRVCLSWQDPKESERRLRHYVNAIPIAFDQDRYLGGVINSGQATTPRLSAGFVRIGSVLCRCLDVYSDVLEKVPFQSEA